MKTLFSLLFCFSLFTVSAQEKEEEVETVTMNPSETKSDTNAIYSWVSVHKFPILEGCSENADALAMKNCFTHRVAEMIEDNRVYPSNSGEIGKLGRVYANFVVQKDGTIGQIEILRGINPVLDAIAFEAIKKIKVLKPAEIDGLPVNMIYTVPVIL